VTTALPALDRVLDSARFTHTGPEAARAAGVDPVWAANLWRAAGFGGDFEAQELSADDVRLLAAADELVRDGRADPIELLQLARTFNLAAAPLADAAAVAIHRRQEAAGDSLGWMSELDSSLAQLEDVLLHTWRRRLIRTLSTGRPAERAAEGVAFADLVGFTDLVRTDDDRWMDALDRLEAICFDVVASHGGRIIKTIGDEVMWIHPEPDGMVRTCAEIAYAFAVDPSLPALRIGAAWGETVATRGDRFGTPVNLASRLVRRCRPGEVLLSSELAAHAPAARPPRRRWIKGLGLVRASRMAPRHAIDTRPVGGPAT
jgi:adenylate cyclase